MRLFWIWFVGAVVWWIDAAIAVHYGHISHALLALLVAMLFLLTAVLIPSSVKKRR